VGPVAEIEAGVRGRVFVPEGVLARSLSGSQ
jgi:hypothetical protein